MEQEKNKKSPLLFGFIFLITLVFCVVSFLMYRNDVAEAQTSGGGGTGGGIGTPSLPIIFKPYGGKIIPRFGTICLGGEPAFDVVTPTNGTVGPFGITPITQRYQYFTTWGLPSRNILLLAFSYKLPVACWSACTDECCNPAGVCPLPAYPVHMFGISLTP
jgi:hypothetical protein